MRVISKMTFSWYMHSLTTDTYNFLRRAKVVRIEAKIHNPVLAEARAMHLALADLHHSR